MEQDHHESKWVSVDRVWLERILYLHLMMPPGDIMDTVYEASVVDSCMEFDSIIDFLPFQDTQPLELQNYQEPVDKALNGDDIFIDSIIKNLLDSDNNSMTEDSIFKNVENLLDCNTAFDNGGISVLGVDLNLYSDSLDNFDNILNDSTDLDLPFSEKVNDLFTNTNFDCNFTIDSAQDNSSDSSNILNMFPHMNDEKNRRRRNLLYENTCTQYVTSTENYKNENGKYHRKRDPLLNHDYTQKKLNEDKYFTCPIANCEKVYAKASHLKAHLRRHSGEKPFVCNWQNCTWRFSRSDELARHKRSHSGIKPYKCELCEKAFARSDHLSKHRKVHKKKMAQCGSYFIKKRSRYT